MAVILNIKCKSREEMIELREKKCIEDWQAVRGILKVR